MVLDWEKIDLKRWLSSGPASEIKHKHLFLNAIIRMAINTKIGMILAQVARVLIKATSLIPAILGRDEKTIKQLMRQRAASSVLPSPNAGKTRLMLI
ncbi:hypothetical protein KIF59_16775 [Enterobacter cloacae subsp. cloacae]|nr:hypothetical protein [Enterobacter cloacae subsp. cloacae]